MKLAEIVEKLDYDVIGNADIDIIGISYPKYATKGMIGIAKRKKDIPTIVSDVVLSHPCFINTEKTLIVTYDDIDMAVYKICKVLIESKTVPDYSLPVKYSINENGIGLGQNVTIGNKTQIEPNVMIGNDVIIGENCIIASGVSIGSGVTIGDNVIIDRGSVIGASSFYHLLEKTMIHFQGIGKVIVNSGVHIGCNTIIQRGTVSDTIIGENCMIGNNIDIGHDVTIGENCKIVSQVGIASNVIIGNNVLIFGQAGIVNDVVIGNNVTVKAKTLVTKSVKDNQTVFGLFGRNFMEEMRIQYQIKKLIERGD